MGRKGIGDGEESKVISFRVSADTHQKLLNKIEATGLTKSEFVRDYVLREKTTVQAADKDAQQHRKKILFTVATASNNLNQIARVLNGQRLAGELDLASCHHAMNSLARIERYLKKFAGVRMKGKERVD